MPLKRERDLFERNRTRLCDKRAEGLLGEVPELPALLVVSPTFTLKSSPETRNIKVILVSSKNQDADRFWGLKQGADDYITKPYPDAALLTAVARHF